MEQNNALPSTIVFQDAQQGMQAFNTANLVFSSGGDESDSRTINLDG